MGKTAETVSAEQRLHENLQKVREAGYNVKVGKAVVKVNGVDCHIGLFESLPFFSLIVLLDTKIGLAAAHRVGMAQ